MNETLKSIFDRRSNRGFSGAALTAEQIKTLADAALAAPTAKNYQDWHFTFVTNRGMLDAFSADYCAIIAKDMEPGRAEKLIREYHLFFHAPLVVFITLPENPKSRFSQVDAGIAAENLAIAAQGMGLGSVIVGRPMEVFNSACGAEWERRLGFPQGHHFAIGIAIGNPTVTKEAHPILENRIHFVE